MNVLFFSADNDASSGAFLSLATLCELLKEFGVSSTVILPCIGDGQRVLNDKGINYRYIKSFNWVYTLEQQKDPLASLKVPVKRLLNIFSTVRIIYFIKKTKIDIVHINASDTYVGAYAARVCKLPLIWHVREFLKEDHGVLFWNEPKSYNTICNADYVITVSNAVANKLRSFRNEAPIHVIYNGIDIKTFSNTRKVFEKEVTTISIVGRICEGKGQKEFIDAIAVLSKKEKIKAYVIGRGVKEYVSFIEEYARDKGLDNILEFVGYIENTSEWYRKSDIVVMASRAEAFGRVTVEAMVSGCLVVGADSGGTSEFVNDGVTGILYDVSKKNDLLSKLEYAVQNKDISRQIAENGRRFSESNLTAFRNAKKIYKIYELCCQE